MVGFDLSIDPDEISVVIKDFVKTYLKKAGCKSVVIGLSGGVDSAVMALLCRDLLGKENTKCLFLPNETTPQVDFDHQKLLVDKFDLSCKVKDITFFVDKLRDFCVVKPDKLAFGNLKTRLRMTLLYEYANVTKSLVCGTSNKSELLVGYFTKYGDGGVDMQPMGDLYKMQVVQLAYHLGIPKELIKKPPSAGLWKGQTDEDELEMDYEILDQILYGLEHKVSISKIAKIAKTKESEVKRIRNLRASSQHKRRSPIIPKIGARTPGLDWRSPVQEG